MYCFKCGMKLPARVVNCPECDTPQKRRQRYRRRMILGLFIFLAGAVAGSLFDTIFFKGQAWEHSFLGAFTDGSGQPQPDQQIASNTLIDSSENAGKTQIAADSASMSAGASFSTSTTFVGSSTHADSAAIGVSQNVNASDSMPTPASASLSVPGNAEIPAASESVAGVDTASTTPTAVDAPLEKKTFPPGRLVFKKAEVLEKSSGSDYHGFMARDGSELIFASNRLKIDGSPVYQCFRRPADGSGAAEKVFAWPGNVWTPETTPDNHMVVFSSDSSKPEHIFVYDRKSGNSMPLTSGTSKNMMPAVSPDGRLIAFVSNRKGNNDIWLIGLDGSNLMQITSGEHDDREPRWSPDGSALIFTRIIEPLKNSQIMQITLEPLGEPQPLVSSVNRNWFADMSPDGRYLTFTRSESTDGSKNVIYMHELATGKESAIKLLAGAECFRPVWNADCSGFVFHATTSQGRSLYQAVFTRENQ